MLNLRNLKGAPLSVIIALMLETGMMEKRLAMVTGYSDATIRQALYYLGQSGIVTRVNRITWQIADGVIQLPIMVPDDNQDTAKQKNFRFGLSKLINLTESPDESLINLTAKPKNFRFDEIWKRMQELGYYGERGRMVAGLEHVTVRMVEYHTRTAPNLNVALLRIQQGWAVPADFVSETERMEAYRKIYDESIIDVNPDIDEVTS